MPIRLWRNMKDDAAYKAAVRAYNDWLAEEYCPVAPDRPLGMAVIPWTNIDDALAELTHAAEVGLKGGPVGGLSQRQGLPHNRR